MRCSIPPRAQCRRSVVAAAPGVNPRSSPRFRAPLGASTAAASCRAFRVASYRRAARWGPSARAGRAPRRPIPVAPGSRSCVPDHGHHGRGVRVGRGGCAARLRASRDLASRDLPGPRRSYHNDKLCQRSCDCLVIRRRASTEQRGLRAPRPSGQTMCCMTSDAASAIRIECVTGASMPSSSCARSAWSSSSASHPYDRGDLEVPFPLRHE
jgi:hypothetical protein